IVGVVELRIAEGGTTTKRVLDLKSTLFKKVKKRRRHPEGDEEEEFGSEIRRCPGSLGFALDLPTDCQGTTSSESLPPSFGLSFQGVPGLRAEVRYFLDVTVKRERFAGLVWWKDVYVLNFLDRTFFF